MIEKLVSNLSSIGKMIVKSIWLAKFSIEKFAISGQKSIELDFALWNDL
jgi:hypothetical protein